MAEFEKFSMDVAAQEMLKKAQAEGIETIVTNGGRADDYTEDEGQRVMNQQEITITIILGRGMSCQEVLTCDFSYDYVRINAEYRT